MFERRVRKFFAECDKSVCKKLGAKIESEDKSARDMWVRAHMTYREHTPTDIRSWDQHVKEYV